MHSHRHARRSMDGKPFYGGFLRVMYAPEVRLRVNAACILNLFLLDICVFVYEYSGACLCMPALSLKSLGIHWPNCAFDVRQLQACLLVCTWRCARVAACAVWVELERPKKARLSYPWGQGLDHVQLFQSMIVCDAFCLSVRTGFSMYGLPSRCMLAGRDLPLLSCRGRLVRMICIVCIVRVACVRRLRAMKYGKCAHIHSCHSLPVQPFARLPVLVWLSGTHFIPLGCRCVVVSSFVVGKSFLFSLCYPLEPHQYFNSRALPNLMRQPWPQFVGRWLRLYLLQRLCCPLPPVPPLLPWLLPPFLLLPRSFPHARLLLLRLHHHHITLCILISSQLCPTNLPTNDNASIPTSDAQWWWYEGDGIMLYFATTSAACSDKLSPCTNGAYVLRAEKHNCHLMTYGNIVANALHTICMYL